MTRPLTPEQTARYRQLLADLNKTTVSRFRFGGAIGHQEPLLTAFLAALENGTDEGVSVSLGKRHGGER